MTTPDCHKYRRDRVTKLCAHALTANHPKAPVYCMKNRTPYVCSIELFDEAPARVPVKIEVKS
jgi:hypothetical protein